jgi:CubicO group peptidase (beta-lactamase class C family)
MPSLQEWLTREARLDREPGTGFAYSNVGFNLLELVVQEVTGCDFAKYMADEVLLPLGMRSSSYAWSADYEPGIPTGYELDGTPVAPYVYPVRASGGLFTNVEDIARFVAAGMRQSADTPESMLGGESIELIYTPHVPISGIFGFVAQSYGLGHFIEILPDGRRAVWHGGQGHGWMTHFHSVPETGDGIVILTNSQRSWPFIAEVLVEWARWSGIGSVGFAKITYATMAMQALIGIIILVSIWLVYRLVRELVRGTRRLAPLSTGCLGVRLLRAAAGIGIIVALVWAAAQPYLFVTSIFPGSAPLAAVLLGIMALILIVSALFPRSVGRTIRRVTSDRA